MTSKNMLFLILIALILTVNIPAYSNYVKIAQARTEQLSDSSNNNLVISMIAPDNWNSGVISQTAASFNWRLNALDATNDASAIFIVVNLPSIFNLALPLGQKSGILSMLLSQYVTLNGESDLTLSDGSSAHRYSISISPEQLHRLKAPIDKGFDGVLITTKQGSITYIIAYASELGRISQFDTTFQNILNSVKFGTVSLSETNSPPTTTGPDVGQPNYGQPSTDTMTTINMTNATMGGNMTGVSNMTNVSSMMKNIT